MLTNIRELFWIISSVFGVLSILTYILINSMYGLGLYINIGMKKENKYVSVFQLVSKMVNIILGVIIIAIFVYYNQSNSNNELNIDKSIVGFIAAIFIIIILVYLRIFIVEKNIKAMSKDYKYIVGKVSKLLNKCYFQIAMIFDVLILICYIFITVSKKGDFDLSLLIFLFPLYCTSILYIGCERYFQRYMNLKEVTINFEKKIENSKRIVCKILWSNDNETCVIKKNNNKIIIIPNRNIVSIIDNND